SVTRTGSTGNSIVTVTSGGTALTVMDVRSTSNLMLDLATHDLVDSNVDTVSGCVGTPGASLLTIKAGGGTNTFTASGGTWNMTSGPNLGGFFLDVKVNSATVNFSGFQTLNRLELNNGGTALFTVT